MRLYQSQSTVRPVDIDKTSSKKFVYVNSNIQVKISVNPDTNEQENYFKYEVCKYSIEEYLQVQVETLQEMNLTLQLALIQIVERG